MNLNEWALYAGLGSGEVRSSSSDVDYVINEARGAYLARVQEEGFEIALPSEFELQIDIDSEQHFQAFRDSIGVILRNWDTSGIDIEIHPSKSGLPRRHITITLPFRVTPWQRIALQAALGSDPVRELLSATRLMRGEPHPTLFAERPTK